MRTKDDPKTETLYYGHQLRQSTNGWKFWVRYDVIRWTGFGGHPVEHFFCWHDTLQQNIDESVCIADYRHTEYMGFRDIPGFFDKLNVGMELEMPGWVYVSPPSHEWSLYNNGYYRYGHWDDWHYQWMDSEGGRYIPQPPISAGEIITKAR